MWDPVIHAEQYDEQSIPERNDAQLHGPTPICAVSQICCRIEPSQAAPAELRRKQFLKSHRDLEKLDSIWSDY